MSVENLSNSNTNAAYQNGDYLKRPRLDTLLKNAMDYPLTVVCAGSGYGKTHAVYSFLQEFNAHTIWMQISERDNIKSRFWESYSSVFSLPFPAAGARIKEIGFSETEGLFAKYNVIRKDVAKAPGKHIHVFDDFHLLYDSGVLRFFEQMISTNPPNMTTILISRTMPEINLINMMMHERVFTIQEDNLRFTKEEIAKYFSRLDLPPAIEDIRNIHDDTQGWAFAINLIGRSIAKKKKYERYALEAMKKNIFRFIEAEIPHAVSEQLRRFLLRVSLIDNLAASLIEMLAKDNALVKELKLINAYIRYDFNLDSYLIHHLFRDYLRQKQEQELTDKERKETYQTAAAWCDTNGYHMDALSYYEKSGDYESITRKIASLNIQLPYDTAQYALGIFDRMPEEAKSLVPLFPSMYIKLKLNLGQFEEAQAFAEQYTRDYECRPETSERNRALSCIYTYWGLLRMNMCTYTDIYDFDIYFKKMAEYFSKNPFKLIGAYRVMSISSRASLVGTHRSGAMEEYINAVSSAAPYLSNTLNGFHDGFEDLVKGELCYYRMEFGSAKHYFAQSIDKACKSDQYVTQNRASVYLMNIDIFHGDFVSATEKLKEMESLLSEKDYGVRYTMYDIAYSFYRLALEQPEQIPEWLKGDFSHYTHPSFMENYTNRARTRYHYQTHRFNALLAYLASALERPEILYDKIELLTLKALSLYRFKKHNEAITAFTEAYQLAESNNILTPFILHAKDMRTLSSAALNDKTCAIPPKWLEDINRKSSAFAKRKAKMLSEYRMINNIKDEIKLTSRENAILRDLADGLSRTEIASSRNISINTVKMVVNSIYDKLYVTSLPEAIHVAADRKII